MSNLSGKYTNGTFEGDVATWGSVITAGVFNGITRSNTFAFEGVYSCRLQTKVDAGRLFYDTALDVIPVTITDQYYEYKIKIRVTAAFPDDALLFLTGDAASTDPNSQNSTTVITGAQAKAGWIELKTLFKAGVIPFGQGTFVFLRICCDIEALLAAVPTFAQQYPALTALSNSTVMVADEFIYLDAIDVAMLPAESIQPAQLVGRKLYHVRNIFFLGNGVDIFEIDEPIGWDKVFVVIDFDKDVFRYKYEFTDKDIVLEFDEAAGRSILKQIWDEQGPEGSASLKFGELDSNNVLTIHYEADLMFDTYNNDGKYKIKMSAERQGTQTALRTRFNVPASVDLPETLDGTAVDALVKRELYFNSLFLKTLSEYIGNANAVNIEEIPFTEEKPNPLDFVYTSVPLLKLNKNNSPGLEDPFVPDGRFLYTGTLPSSIAKRRINVSVTIKMSATLGGSGQQMYMGIILYKVQGVTNPDQSIGIPFDAINIGGSGGFGGTNGESYSAETLLGLVPLEEEEEFIETLTVEGGFVLGNDEAVFLKVYLLANELVEIPINASAWLNPEIWIMEIEESTVVKPVTKQVYPIHELLNRQLEIITDKIGILKSDFFGRVDLGYAANGCGSNYGAISGEQLRGFAKPMNLSASNWVRSLGTLFCLGASLERDNNNNEFFRVEPLPYFFRNVELFYFPIITQYGEESANDFIFNELEFGYTKFLNNNQPGSRRDFMNKKQYLTSFKKVQNKLIKTVDWILSSQYINLTLQQNIVDNPDNAYETDKDIFLVHHQAEPVTNFTKAVQIEFIAATKTIVISDTSIPIKEGDIITINGTDNNDGPKTIVTLDMAVPFWAYIEVTEALVDEVQPNTNIDFTARYVPKHDEDFESVIGVNPTTGVLDNEREAATNLNLRHHVKRIAQRWSKFFMTNEPTEIKFIAGNSNDTLETALALDAECQNLETSNNPLATVKDASTDAADPAPVPSGIWDKPLFGKNIFNYSAPISWDVWNELRKAFEGRHPDGKDYGYFSFLDPDQVVKKGYLLNAKFDPEKQMCKLQLIEKGTYHD